MSTDAAALLYIDLRIYRHYRVPDIRAMTDCFPSPTCNVIDGVSTVHIVCKCYFDIDVPLNTKEDGSQLIAGPCARARVSRVRRRLRLSSSEARHTQSSRGREEKERAWHIGVARMFCSACSSESAGQRDEVWGFGHSG